MGYVPKKQVSLFKSKLFKMGCLFAFALSAILIVFAMQLGNEAGQFVIRVQNGNVEKSIAITTDLEDKTTYSSKLNVQGMSNMTDYSPEYFLERDYATLQDITEKTGFTNYDNNSLYIYTFYIVNTSKSGGVGVKVTLDMAKVTNHLDDVIRVLTYSTSYNVDDPEIYQKEDDLPKLQAKFPTMTKVEYPNYILQPTNFKDDKTVFDDQTINIGFGEGQNYVKYSIMFWIEGNDPDSDYWNYEDPETGQMLSELFNATIRFSLTISVEM